MPDGLNSPGNDPLVLRLYLVRAKNAGEPHNFQFEAQDYILLREGRGARNALFPWSEELLKDLANLAQEVPDRRAVQRLGSTLREFLARLEWIDQEERLERALAQGYRIHLTIRAAAAEMYCLPWELLSLRSTGQHLGELGGCVIRYEWPERPEVFPEVRQRSTTDRVLFAWSAAGGWVPAGLHLRALRNACAKANIGFDPSRDVVGNVSASRLSQWLDAVPETISALHLLCHTGSDPTGLHGLRWNASKPGMTVETLNPGALRQLLAPHAGRIRTVVLCACRSGDSCKDLGSHLGSVARELHRAGIPVVVASRLPLTIEGSVALTDALYPELLKEGAMAAAAVAAARSQLAKDPLRYTWASLQLWEWAEQATQSHAVTRNEDDSGDGMIAVGRVMRSRLPVLLDKLGFEPAPTLLRANVSVRVVCTGDNRLDRWTYVCASLASTGRIGLIHAIRLIDVVQREAFSDELSMAAAEIVEALLGIKGSHGHELSDALRAFVLHEAQRWNALRREFEKVACGECGMDKSCEYIVGFSEAWVRIAEAIGGEAVGVSHASSSIESRSSDLTS